MITTDVRTSLRGLYDKFLVDDGSGGYSLKIEGDVIASDLQVIEYFSGSTSTTHTLAGTGKGISISNDGCDSMSFTIGSIEITLLEYDVFNGNFDDFTEVVITNASSNDYRITILG